MADRPYVRVFHADLIRDYPHIWDDDAALAAWLRLLVVADGSWPAPAELPRSVRPRSLTVLTDAGLVGMDGPHRFRIKGMDSDRSQRQDAARNAAAKRWHSGAQSEGIKRGDAPAMPNNAEQSNAEQRNGAPASNDDARADLEAFLLLTRRAPTPRQRQLLDGLMDRHDLTGPQWAADIMLRHPDDPIGAVIAADKEWRAERIAEAQAAEKPKPIPRRPRGLPQSTRELVEHWAAQAVKKP